MAETEDELAAEGEFVLPAVPVSAGALIFDRHGQLLILKPTYKSGWTIPGGVMESDGETPWEACQREVREECGLQLTSARLACMDFRRPRADSPGGIRYLFDCGAFDDAVLRSVALQTEEISEHRLVPMSDALSLLRKPIRRRVKAVRRRNGDARKHAAVIYLEDGRPVTAVRS